MSECDIAIIGGSNAGLSAALILGRARRKVLIIDAGEPRNASAGRTHGFFTRDGAPPADLRRTGREQLEPYDVAFVEARATHVTGHDLDFTLTLASGQNVRAKKLVLATGVQDDTGILPGLRDLWGRYVYTCPYCHGWEVRDKPLAIIGSGEEGYQYARFVRNWSRQLTLCTHGGRLEPDALGHLTQLGIKVIDTEIDRLSADAEAVIHFGDTTALRCAGIFIRPPVRLNAPLADALGCTLSDDGTYVVTDETGQTSVQGVYAVGDLARPKPAISLEAALVTDEEAAGGLTLWSSFHDPLPAWA